MDSSFWIGTHLKDFLFEGYTVSSFWGLLATCVGVACIAILYEGGWVYRVSLKSQMHILPDIKGDVDSTFETRHSMASWPGNQSSRLSTESRITNAAKYAMICIGHDLMGYILMLVIASMNFGLAFAVWCGAGIGYFVFAANISNAVTTKQSASKCTNDSERERNLESRSCDDLTATSDCDREEINGEEGTSVVNAKQQSSDSRSENVNDKLEDSPVKCDRSQGHIVISQALVHKEPSP